MASPPYSGPRWASADPFTTAIHVVFGGIAGILVLIMMGVTVVDVCGRYLFGAPLPGGFEVTQLLMAALIYGALPSVSRQEGHITIDLIDAVTPEGLVRLRQILVNLVATMCFGIIAWRLWIIAEKTRDYGDVTEYLRFPRAPIIYVMAALSAIAAIVLLANVFRYLRGAREPVPGFI